MAHPTKVKSATQATCASFLLCLGTFAQADPTWDIQHQRQFDAWDSVCDICLNATSRQKRCYSRSIHRFEEESRLGALILFVVIERNQPRVQLVGPVGGTVVSWNAESDPDGRSIPMSEPELSCEHGRVCDLDAIASRDFIAAAGRSSEINICFAIESSTQCETVSLSGFSDALVDASRAFMMGPHDNLTGDLSGYR